MLLCSWRLWATALILLLHQHHLLSESQFRETYIHIQPVCSFCLDKKKKQIRQHLHAPLYPLSLFKWEASQLSTVKYGVPQGSVLGPLLFSFYRLPLGNSFRKYKISFHYYAYDIKLYISTRPDETSKLSKLKECVKNIKYWMTNIFLLLNSDKTEILLIGPKNSTQNTVQNLGSQFATRRMYCYFLYSQESGYYIRQQPIF